MWICGTGKFYLIIENILNKGYRLGEALSTNLIKKTFINLRESLCGCILT